MAGMFITAREPIHSSLSRVSEGSVALRAGALLADAFASDPVMHHAMPSAPARAAVLPLLYEKTCLLAARVGGLELTAERACVLWLDSQMEAPFLLAIISGFWRVLLRMGPRALLRIMRHESFCAARAHRFGPARYGYVWILGTATAHQGEGWGGALLARALAVLAARGHRVCLLKTEKESNVAFYQRQGFVCIDTEIVPSSGIRYWLLQRELSDAGAALPQPGPAPAAQPMGI